MALTPFLSEVGREVAEYIERESEDPSLIDTETKSEKNFQANNPVVVIGFGQMGQVLANFLSTPLATGLGGDAAGWPYVAFNLDPGRLKAACKLGFSVLYGDGSQPVVLQTAGSNGIGVLQSQFAAGRRNRRPSSRGGNSEFKSPCSAGGHKNKHGSHY